MRNVGFLTLGLVGLAVAVACGSESSPAGGGGTSGTSGQSSGFSSGGVGDGGNGTSGGPSCATGEAGTGREPVYIDIILDGSRSMDGHASTAAGCDDRYGHGSESTCFIAGARETDPLSPTRDVKVCHSQSQPVTDCPNFRGLTGKKWLAIRGALLAFFDAAKTRADKRLGLGMLLFRSDIEKPFDQWDVEPGFVDDAKLAQLKTRISPPNFATTSGTPLKESIQKQTPLLRTFAPKAPLEAGGKRVFLVITDGAASDCDGDGEPECPDIITAVTNLRTGTPSITTFVIGVGDPAAEDDSVYSETFLSKLASVGGSAPAGCNDAWDGRNPTGTPCHFQITPGAKSAAVLQQEMTDAINAIANNVQSCELVLNKTSPIDPTKVNVVFTSKGTESQIAKDPGNGWVYDNEADPTKVILNGSSCAALKADVEAKVSIVIGCPTGVVVR